MPFVRRPRGSWAAWWRARFAPPVNGRGSLRGRLFSERITPLLAHVFQIVKDIIGDDASDLDLVQRFRSRDLRAERLLERVRFDLRGVGAEQELHEQSGCAGMLAARHDAGGP